MPRYALGIAYNGSELHGWQRQAAVPTVQGSLEQALSLVADEPLRLQGAGRTDAGVHATGQVAHFDTNAARPNKAWLHGTNAHLPACIRVRWVQPVPDSFHARFTATARRYQYLFYDGQACSPLMHRQVWDCEPLDSDAMHRAAQHLLGEQDFSALRAAGCQSTSPVRCVQQVRVTRHHQLVVLDVQANAFLLHMVRNMARALYEVGRGQRPGAWVPELLAGCNRTALGATASPYALYLVDVAYPLQQTGGVALPAGLSAPLLQALGDLRSS